MSDKSSKKSIVVLVTACFWLAYVAILVGEYYYNIESGIDHAVENRKKNLEYVLDSGLNAIVNNNIDYLKDRLDQGRELGFVNFYILQHKEKPVAFYHPNNDLAAINHDYKNFGRFMETKDLVFKTIKVYDYRLTAGFNTSRSVIFWESVKQQKYLILHDIILVTSILGAFLYLFMKDIINLTKVLESRDRSRIGKIKATSRESLALITGAQALDQSHRDSAEQAEFFATTLTPAILQEIRLKTPVSSTFPSTLVRVDLNGYTQLYLEKKDEYVNDILNKYFVQAREIIERYEGLIYQYVGDEVVFHFKGEAKYSAPLALACVRSLFELAIEIERELPPQAGHYFKLKASMSPGLLRFVKLDTGFGLSGLPLIESARLLGQVHDKSQNCLAFEENCLPYLKKLCVYSEPKESLLKGFSESSKIYFVSQFIEYAEGPLVAYYRTDKDMALVLESLYKCVHELNDEKYFALFSGIKHVKFRAVTKEFVESMSSFLQQVLVFSKEKAVHPKVLAAVISMTQNLVPPEHATEELRASLLEYLKFSDPRVQANTVSALGDMGNIRYLRKYIYSTNNRLSADALIVAGKQVVDKELVHRVKELLGSTNPVYQASGRYVAVKLVEYYKEKDPVYFGTSPHIKKLIELSTIPVEKSA